MFHFQFDFKTLITLAFMCVTVLSLSAYVPQVLASLRSKQIREGTVLMTWWIWTIASLIEALYMAFVVKNFLLVSIALIHLVACAIVAIAGTLQRLSADSKDLDVHP